MKCQNLFSGKNKKNISICLLLKFFTRVLSVDLFVNKHMTTDTMFIFSTLTLTLLGNFACFFCHLINFFKKIFQEYLQGAKHLGVGGGGDVTSCA